MRAKIFVLAPIAPFRGGIARHTTALARSLATRVDADVEIESFARLYPRLLYPGENDRDDTFDGTLPFSHRYSIDTLDPLTWHRAASRIARQPGSLAIIPAWTFFVAPMFGWIARRLRRRGITVVMIVHNTADHERGGWKSRLLNWQLAAASGFVTHTAELKRQLREAGHAQPLAVNPHPPYADFPPAKGTLRREYKLELLCFGLVRRYKGVDVALRAFALARLRNARLTIAGEVWEDAVELRALIDRLGLEKNVKLIDRYVSDEEAAELFDRCDAVLAPYRSVTGSGVLALAQHYRRPVVATDLPGFRESVHHERTGWLFPAGDEKALAALLNTKVTRGSAIAMRDNLVCTPDLDQWQVYCQTIIELAEQITESKQSDQ